MSPGIHNEFDKGTTIPSTNLSHLFVCLLFPSSIRPFAASIVAALLYKFVFVDDDEPAPTTPEEHVPKDVPEKDSEEP